MSTENLGVDQLLPSSSLLGELITSIVTLDENQDGQIQLLEAVNKLQTLAFKAYTVYNTTDWQTAKAQLKDIDTGEILEIVETVAVTFDIPNDEAETLIEDWAKFIFRTLDEGAELVARTQQMFAVNETPEPNFEGDDIADENQ